MFVCKASTARNASHARLADPDAETAYRSLEEVLAVAGAPPAPDAVRALVHEVLHSYSRALGENRTAGKQTTWAAFVRTAALLYFALNRRSERYADERWRQAAATLQAIALENADLLAGSPREEAS